MDGWHVPLGQPFLIYVRGQRHFGRVAIVDYSPVN